MKATMNVNYIHPVYVLNKIDRHYTIAGHMNA